MLWSIWILNKFEQFLTIQKQPKVLILILSMEKKHIFAT